VLNTTVAEGPQGRVIAMDSITLATPADAGAYVVSGSHGGVSSGAFALEIPFAGVFFNDAGIGKEGAGVVALEMLQERGIPAGTVAHTSARIGDARDAWENGILSRCNAAAIGLGLAPGTRLKSALSALIAR